MKKTLYITLALLLLFGAGDTQATVYGSVTVSRVVDVYDGDTIKVDIDAWPAVAGRAMPVRVNGVDTPEIRGRCAAERRLAFEAREYVKRLLLVSRVVELRNVRRGKFFRLAADVFVDGKSLGRRLVDLGYARRSSRAAGRVGWCL